MPARPRIVVGGGREHDDSRRAFGEVQQDGLQHFDLDAGQEFSEQFEALLLSLYECMCYVKCQREKDVGSDRNSFRVFTRLLVMKKHNVHLLGGSFFPRIQIISTNVSLNSPLRSAQLRPRCLTRMSRRTISLCTWRRRDRDRAH